MTSLRSLLKSASRIAIVGVAAGAVAFAALPAQAAGPSLGTSLDLGLDVAKPQVQQQQGQGQMQMKKFGYDDDDDDYWCADLSNKQIRKGLKKTDFDEIDFVKELKHDRVRVEALYEGDGWVYSMRIDRCDGEVDQIKPLYEYEDFDIDFDF
jgi:hypothetical protein